MHKPKYDVHCLASLVPEATPGVGFRRTACLPKSLASLFTLD